MRALLVIALVACGSKSPASGTVKQPSGPVLYDRIGRMDAIKGIVKDFVEEQLLKGSLAPRFTNVNVAMLEDSLSTQLCELTAGPCKYVGRSMREAHAGMAISDADFAAFIAAFEQSLIKFKVDATEQRELVALLRTLKSDVLQGVSAF
jgi:hemoglobin